jgi:hypothetical protein
VRLVSRLLLLAVLACLVVAGTASANHQDPQKRLTKEDNARARAMLVTRADVPGFRVQRGAGPDPHVECASSVSEADLTLTGEAEGKQFESGIVFVTSGSQLYETIADADASWRRSTSTAGLACAKATLEAAYKTEGATVKSLTKVPFPRFADETVAFRVTLSLRTPQGAVPFYMDIVGIAHGRAHASIAVAAALAKPTKTAEIRLARSVAGRMKRAMRGA